MTNLSNLFFRAAFVFLGAGILMGTFMSLSQDFTIRVVHVHVNLLGWVGFFLYASFYRFFPNAAGTRLARAHFWSAIIGLPPMMLGLTLVVLGYGSIGLPLLLGGELVTVISVALFICIGFLATAAAPAHARGHRITPAE